MLVCLEGIPLYWPSSGLDKRASYVTPPCWHQAYRRKSPSHSWPHWPAVIASLSHRVSSSWSASLGSHLDASARGLNGPAKEGKVLCSLLPTYDARPASRVRSTPAGGATIRRRSGCRRLVARIHRLWRSPLTLHTTVSCQRLAPTSAGRPWMDLRAGPADTAAMGTLGSASVRHPPSSAQGYVAALRSISRSRRLPAQFPDVWRWVQLTVRPPYEGAFVPFR